MTQRQCAICKRSGSHEVGEPDNAELHSNEIHVRINYTSGFLATLYVATYKGGSRHMERTTVSHEDQVLQQEQPCPHTGKVDPAFWILAWSGPAARIAVHCVDRSSQPAEGRWYASRCHI